MTNNELILGIGIFIIGVFAGVVFMNNYYPSTYQGKSAEEWNAEYTKAQGKLDINNQVSQLPDPYEGLISCLTNLNRYTDYYGNTAYYVVDVYDVTNCIGDARQQQYDNSSQMIEQQQQYP